MFIDKKTNLEDYKIVINPNIHKKAKLSREEFLDRISSVKYIRCGYLKKLTVYITSPEEFNFLEKLHIAINQDEIIDDSSYYITFGFGIPEKVYKWFKNNDLEVIQKQIICWLASKYFFSEHDRQIMKEDIYEPVLSEIEKISNKFISKKINPYRPLNIDDSVFISELEEIEGIYIEICNDYYGSRPPEILNSPIDLNTEAPGWGEIHNFNFYLIDAYFRNDDWDKIIVNGNSKDDLNRAESNKQIWDKWLHTYTSYPLKGNNTFSLIENNLQKGFIYIIQQEDSGYYKIGWTINPNIEKSRLNNLQIGNPHKLNLIGFFRVASKKAEKTIHQIFKQKRIKGEWFFLDNSDIDNLMDTDWRIRQNIF
jgi:hypothetical protein